MEHKLIVILGPTAVGKTNIAVNLAHRFNGEIISADSRQVYNRMDIGTGKDLDEYIINGNKIPYHLINVVEPTEEFNLFQFQRYFYDSFDKITELEKLPFLVGGTGLYIQSILKDYHFPKVNLNSNRVDELESKSLNDLREILKKISSSLHNTTDLKIKERVIKAILIAESDKADRITPNIEFDSLVIGIEDVRDNIKQNITKRLKQRLNEGMVEEVEALVNEGISYDKLDFFGLEYKFIGRYLKGELNYNDMYQKLNSAIHNFAKRQMTWFRKMEREGIIINWFKNYEFEKAEMLIKNFINRGN